MSNVSQTKILANGNLVMENETKSEFVGLWKFQHKVQQHLLHTKLFIVSSHASGSRATSQTASPRTGRLVSSQENLRTPSPPKRKCLGIIVYFICSAYIHRVRINTGSKPVLWLKKRKTCTNAPRSLSGMMSFLGTTPLFQLNQLTRRSARRTSFRRQILRCLGHWVGSLIVGAYACRIKAWLINKRSVKVMKLSGMICKRA